MNGKIFNNVYNLEMIAHMFAYTNREWMRVGEKWGSQWQNYTIECNGKTLIFKIHCSAEEKIK